MFKSLVDGLVSDALKLVDDLANKVTLVKYTGQTYDPRTGPVDTYVEYPGLNCVMPKFTAEEKDDEVVILTDKKGLIARADLPAGVEIEQNDEIRDGTVLWDVKRILSVPGDSLYILHLRKKR
jgi:hypothetical protein